MGGRAISRGSSTIGNGAVGGALRVSRSRDGAAPGAALAIDAAPLCGRWVSFDAATRGIARIEVRAAPAGSAASAAPAAGGGPAASTPAAGAAPTVPTGTGAPLVVRVFGSFPPGVQDWGEAAGEAFAGGVEGGAAAGFTAWFRFGFLDVMLAAYLNRRLLVVDSYNVFRDGSGRSGYFARDHFYLPAESARG